MTDFSVYAGRWVMLSETETVVSVGTTPAEVRKAGRQARPKDYLRLVWISPHPPHLALPEWPIQQLRPLLQGQQIWLVGGAVRDLLLGRRLHDWDFAVAGPTLALTRRIANALGGAYVILDAERDTARVVINDPSTQQPITLDFAALRGTSIAEDLAWRDLTINAMALTLDGKLIDLNAGLADLEARRIRAYSPTTFTDDPARLLRALRTAGELEFTITEKTLAHIRRHAPLITHVAGERIRAELVRILNVMPAAPLLEQAESLGLLVEVLPEISALHTVNQSWPHHYDTVWGHTLAILAAHEGLEALLRGKPVPHAQQRRVGAPGWAWKMADAVLTPLQPDLLAYLQEPLAAEMPRSTLLKWGTLLHDSGKAHTRTVDKREITHFYGHEDQGAELAQRRLKALHFSNRACDFVTTLVAAHMRLISLSKTPPPTRRASYRFYRDTGDAGVGVVLLALADTLAIWGPQLKQRHWQRVLETTETLLNDYFSRPEEVVTPPSLLNGHDLMKLGVPQGPEIGKLIEQLREGQAAGEIQDREAALAFVRAQLPS